MKRLSIAVLTSALFNSSAYGISSSDKLTINNTFNELKSYSTEMNVSLIEGLVSSKARTSKATLKMILKSWGEFLRSGGNINLDGLKSQNSNGTFTYYYTLVDKDQEVFSDFAWDITFKCDSGRFLASDSKSCSIVDIN